MTNVDELPTFFDSSTCIKKGLCPVTKLRKQEGNPVESHEIYFEIHGSKEIVETSPAADIHKIVLIMGMNASSFSWSSQVNHFPHTGKHEVLVFDNRGVGNSGYPLGPYTSSGMAEDVIALLEYVGWTDKRSLNIVGISLGGMISQELAFRIPDRIRSMLLAVTTPGGSIWNNMPPWTGFVALTKLVFIADPVKKVPHVMINLFPDEWLDSPAADDPNGRTNKQVQTEMWLRRIAVAKPQQAMGSFSQMSAALSHYVSPDRLFQIANNIPKIAIVTGDHDNLVQPWKSTKIFEGMTVNGTKNLDKVEHMVWENTGHGIQVQQEKKFNELVERVCEEGHKLVSGGV